MKKLALAITAALTLASAAHADSLAGAGLEMQTFLHCTPTRLIPDAGVEVSLRQERVGAYKDALVSTSSIAGAHDEVYANLSSRPEIIEGDEAVGTVYTASIGRKQLMLTVDFSQGDGETSPAVLELDGSKRDLVCRRLVVLF